MTVPPTQPRKPASESSEAKALKAQAVSATALPEAAHLPLRGQTLAKEAALAETQVPPVPHIAVRTHLNILDSQVVEVGKNNYVERQFLSVTLCGAPFIGNPTNPPPQAGDALPLHPYLPWAWKWLDHAEDAGPGFRWRLLVLLEKRDGGALEWQPVPEDLVKIYAVPAGVHDLLKSADGDINPTIRSIWWEPELRRMTLGKDELGKWFWTKQIVTVENLRGETIEVEQYPAHAVGVARIADPERHETVVKDGDQDKHEDLFGERQMRWATANTPFNYVNRLAAAFSIPAAADFKTRIEAALPDYTVPADCTLTATAHWEFATDSAAPPKPIFYYTASDPDIVIFEQTEVPANGQPDGSIPTLRRTYSNTVAIPVAAATSSEVLTVEIEPWRVDVETRVSRCIDLPFLLLEWAAFLPSILDKPPENPSPDYLELEKLDGFVRSRVFVEWIAGLSADLFQAGHTLKPPAPGSPRAWLEQLRNMSSAPDQPLVDPDTKKHFNEIVQALLDLLLPSMTSIHAPRVVVPLLDQIAGTASSPNAAKAQEVVAKLDPQTREVLHRAEPIVDLLCATGHLPADIDSQAASDLAVAVRVALVLPQWIQATEKAGSSLLSEDALLKDHWEALKLSGSSLERVLAASATTRVQRLARLREFIQLLRDGTVFEALRAQVATPDKGTMLAPEKERLSEALEWLLQRPFNISASEKTTLFKEIVPTLRSPENTIAGLTAQLRNYLSRRREDVMESGLPVPTLPSSDDVLETLFIDSFHDYLSRGKPEEIQRNAIYGNFRRPISKPHGFVLVADVEEKVVLNDQFIPGSLDKKTSAESSLDEEAGAIVLGRVALRDRENGNWHCLNAGCLQVQAPVTEERYATEIVSYPPLRGSYVNNRRSVRADYDNRPLVAISRKRDLVKTFEAQLEAELPENDPTKQCVKVDYLWPADGDHRLPALRYYGHDAVYRFCWVTLSNACCLPEGFWKDHPAILDVSEIPEVDVLKTIPHVQVSDPDPYLRRVGIAMPHLKVTGTQNVQGVWSPEIFTEENESQQVIMGWPAVPANVHPLSAEIEGMDEIDPEEPFAAKTRSFERAPVNGRRNAPLCLLFPAETPDKTPYYVEPTKLIRGIKLEIGKPSTGDDNWERWISAVTPDDAPDGPKITKWRKQRVTVCANAHEERDDLAKGPLGPSPGASLKHQPDDPALRNEFLIVFRGLYPHPKVHAFVRKWNGKDDPLIGEFFTKPYSITINRNDSIAAGDLVTAHGDIFAIEKGAVVEVAIYALLDNVATSRFLDELIKLDDARPRPLGLTLEELLGDEIPSELLPLDPDVKTWLAVSPAYFRVETARLHMPKPSQVYKRLIASAQGGKVSLGVDTNRPSTEFDWVHDVVVQEQIWRWHGKPCLPEEDFPGVANLQLPKPGKVIYCEPTDNLTGSEPVPTNYFPWDAIAFHQREDIEHRGVICILPLAQKAPEPDRELEISPTGDILFTDDKTSDLRSLYFRFSVQMRSRYFGAWPDVVQAGEDEIVPTRLLWKRYALPQRLTTPLKKPAVKIVIPLMCSGEDDPGVGNTAGMCVIVRESAFEQAGLAEKFECELVNVASYKKENGVVIEDGTRYYQAGYDPVLSSEALLAYQAEDPFVRISGPVGLTFDQGGRDPLIVNTMFHLTVDHEKLRSLLNDSPTPVYAGHLFCKLRFRRTIRAGYDVIPPVNGRGETREAAPAPHSLASEWTESEWIKFLPDTDLLRPNPGDETWKISSTPLTLNFTRPTYGRVGVFREKRGGYLFCVTTHELDANARPGTEFHSLYQVDDAYRLSLLVQAKEATEFKSPYTRLCGRIVEIFSTDDNFIFGPGENWWHALFPPPGEVTTSDAKVIVQAISARFPIS